MAAAAAAKKALEARSAGGAAAAAAGQQGLGQQQGNGGGEEALYDAFKGQLPGQEDEVGLPTPERYDETLLIASLTCKHSSSLVHL